MGTRAHPVGRRAWLVVLALVLPSCVEETDLRDIDPTIPEIPDEEHPVSEILEPEVALEVGRTIDVSVSDDTGVSQAFLRLYHGEFAEGEEEPELLWTSDTMYVGNAEEAVVEITIQDLPPDFPFGEEVMAVAWVRDEVGKVRYTGAPDDDPLNLEEASLTPLTIYEGQTHRIEAGEIGAIAYNDLDGQIYYTNVERNHVGIFDFEGMALSDDVIPVGSRPRELAFRRYAWGSQPALAVINSGGTDVSIVDITERGGGQERWRIVLPIIEAEVGEEEMTLDPDVSSVLIKCPDVICDQPILYLASPRLGSSEPAIIRSLEVTAPDPAARFSVLSPGYSPVLEADEPVTVRAEEIDRQDGEATLLFEADDRSRCGTLAFGSSSLTTSHEVDGSFFVAERGEADDSCDPVGGGRIVRFDPDPQTGDHFVSQSAIINFDYDPNLHDGGIEELDVNDDGSVVVAHNGSEVFVTDGDLRRLGTIEVGNVHAISFLSGHTGGPGPASEGAMFAVSSDEGLVIYETRHFTEVTRFRTAATSRGELEFVPTNDHGDLAIFGVDSNDEGILVLETSMDEILRRGPGGT